MLLRLAADATLVVHLAYILFVVFGAALALRWGGTSLVHVPAAVWGVFVEVNGRICPLTTLENHLRRAAGEAGYRGSFVENYLLPVVYPDGLTRDVQMLLAGGVVLINAALYGLVFIQRKRRPS